jgi:hypothetical protein
MFRIGMSCTIQVRCMAVFYFVSYQELYNYLYFMHLLQLAHYMLRSSNKNKNFINFDFNLTF